MAEYIDREKLIPDRCYYEPYGYDAISCEQIFHEDVADVVEREKIDKAIEEMERYSTAFEHANRHDLACAVDYCIGVIQENIGESK